jgi:hypothetical protein
MADNKKISDLPEDTSVTLADYIPIVTPGSNLTKKASLARVIALAGSGGSGGGTGTSAVFLDNFVVNLPNNQTGIPNGTTVNAGDPIAPFIEAAFRKSSPAQYTGPNLSLSGISAPAVIEVGTPISIAFTISFAQNDAGNETSRSLSKNGSPLTASSGLYSDSIIAATSPTNYVATLSYAQGHINNDSLGNPDPSGQMPAGAINSNTLSYQGFYKLWYDAVSTLPATSPAVRSLTNSRFSNAGNSFTLNTGSTQQTFVLLLPPGKSLASVIDQDALNLDITAQYLPTSITVNDAGGTAVTYTMYTMSQSVAYSSNHRHNITIA